MKTLFAGLSGLTLLTLSLLISGCGVGAALLNPAYDPTTIYSNERAGFKGKQVKHFEVYYHKTGMYEIFIPTRPSILTVEFDVCYADADDLQKLHDIIYSFYSQRYYPSGYFLRKTQYRAGWVYAKEKYFNEYVPESYTSVVLMEEDKIIKVQLGCNMGCDPELLHALLEKNAVAPLTPNAKENYETLKLRLKE